jgi:molecular chaperone HscB
MGGDMKEAAMDNASAGSGTSVTSCWSCHGPVDRMALFCHVCGALQPPGSVSHFARLGLAPSFDLDMADLNRRYVAFQQRLHPDRFAGKSVKERALAEQQTVSLNEAYETLKDPLRRGAYLLQLAGLAAPTSEAKTIDDPGLLMETMERREALAEADGMDTVVALAADAAAAEATCLERLAEAFADNRPDDVTKLLIRLRYLRKFAEEARARRAVLSEAIS